MTYNTIIKRFPDGTTQYLFCNFEKDTEQTKEKSLNHNGNSVKRKELDNMKRARQNVFDICRSNQFDWFITLTLDPKICDSFNYDECRKELSKFTKWLTDHNLQYVIVPEQHKSGRFHFHGLIQGFLPVSPALREGEVIPNLFWVEPYKSGYTTATKIKDSKRVSTYITKYLAKDMSVPKGKKRYWASNGLVRPELDKITLSTVELQTLLFSADYYKRIPSDYGTYYLIEKNL